MPVLHGLADPLRRGDLSEHFELEGLGQWLGSASISDSEQDHDMQPHTEKTALSEYGAMKTDVGLQHSEVAAVLEARFAEHQTRTCRPCVFFRRDPGCPIGAACKYCHFEHDLPTRRMCKKKRKRIQQALQSELAQTRLASGDALRPEEIDNEKTAVEYEGADQESSSSSKEKAA
mmetsp:Transcript_146860/g.381649  ORF Transcript_146860/g.381649 Transcript_146860/m.381649 type:complete len:175 (-) Transcript_146860:285-809(-)